MLKIVASYHPMQFQGKLMNQTWKNSKKPSFGLLAHLAQIRLSKILLKNLARSVTRFNGQLLSCTISERINNPTFRKLSDGQKDGQADRQAEADAVWLTSSVQ